MSLEADSLKKMLHVEGWQLFKLVSRATCCLNPNEGCDMSALNEWERMSEGEKLAFYQGVFGKVMDNFQSGYVGHVEDRLCAWESLPTEYKALQYVE